MKSNGSCPADAPVAAIDVGSHSAKLLIAHRGAGGRPEQLVFELRPIGLSRSLEAAGTITEQAFDPARRALMAFLEQAHEIGVAEVRAVGTEALRRTPGADGIVAAFREESGHAIEIISSAREAELTARALEWDPAVGQRALVANVGGGSTELVLVEKGGLSSHESFPIGAAVLTEKYQPDHGPCGMARLLAQVAGGLGESSVLARAVGATLIGMGGTIAQLAAMDRKLPEPLPDQVQAHVLATERLVELVAELSRMEVEERTARAFIPPDRAPVIIAGGLIYVTLALTCRAESIHASSRGIVHGLVLEMLGN